MTDERFNMRGDHLSDACSTWVMAWHDSRADWDDVDKAFYVGEVTVDLRDALRVWLSELEVVPRGDR